MSRTRILLQDDPGAVGWLHGLPSVGDTIELYRDPFDLPTRPQLSMGFAASVGVSDADFYRATMTENMYAEGLWTASFWIYRNGSTTGNGVALECLNFALSDNGTSKLRYFSDQTSDRWVRLDTAINDSKWHHIVVGGRAVAGATPDGLIDGVRATWVVDTAGSGSLSGAGPQNSLSIGGVGWGSRAYNGYLCEVGFWLRDLSLAEKMDVYRHGPLVQPKGLVFYDPLSGRPNPIVGGFRSLTGTKSATAYPNPAPSSFLGKLHMPHFYDLTEEGEEILGEYKALYDDGYLLYGYRDEATHSLWGG